MLYTGKIASFLLDGREICLDAPAPGEDEARSGAGETEARAAVKRVDGALEWTLRLKNTGTNDSGRITEFCGLDIELPCGRDDSAVFCTLTGDDCGDGSFMPVTRELKEGDRLVTIAETGRPSEKDAFPFFDVTVNGVTAVFGIGWSGKWKRTVERRGGRIRVTACQNDCDFYLLPGEEARSVRALVYFGEGGAELSRRGFLRTVRRHFCPKNTLAPVALSCFDRYYGSNHGNFRSEATQLRLAEKAEKLKNVDTFWLDACWFEKGFPDGVGNYSFEPEFPDGITALSEKVHSSGKKLIVWFEPERIHLKSDIYARFGDNGDFVLKGPAEPRYPNDRGIGMLNLGCEAAFEHVCSVIGDFIEKYGVDVMRIDHNFSPSEFWSPHDEPGRLGITEMRSVEGLYAFWDRMLERFPKLVIDNCASGGRRIDLETVSRSVSLWSSDVCCWRESEKHRLTTIEQNMGVALSRYIPNHQLGCWEPEAYDIRSAMGAGVACDFDVLDDSFDFERADRALAEVRRLAPYREGHTVELTELTNDESVIFGYELLVDGACCVFAFRREGCGTESFSFDIVLPEGERFEVTLTDEEYEQKSFVMSREELSRGLKLALPRPRASLTAEIKALRT